MQQFAKNIVALKESIFEEKSKLGLELKITNPLKKAQNYQYVVSFENKSKKEQQQIEEYRRDVKKEIIKTLPLFTALSETNTKLQWLKKDYHGVSNFEFFELYLEGGNIEDIAAQYEKQGFINVSFEKIDSVADHYMIYPLFFYLLKKVLNKDSKSVEQVAKQINTACNQFLCDPSVTDPIKAEESVRKFKRFVAMNHLIPYQLDYLWVSPIRSVFALITDDPPTKNHRWTSCDNGIAVALPGAGNEKRAQDPNIVLDSKGSLAELCGLVYAFMRDFTHSLLDDNV